MTDEEINYVMPKPSFGYPIKFFPHGFDDGKPTFAYAANVGEKSIDIITPLRAAHGGVMHISDPRLKRSEDMRREHGAWDFAGNDYEVSKMKEEIAILKQQIRTLLDKPASEPKDKTK